METNKGDVIAFEVLTGTYFGGLFCVAKSRRTPAGLVEYWELAYVKTKRLAEGIAALFEAQQRTESILALFDVLAPDHSFTALIEEAGSNHGA